MARLSGLQREVLSLYRKCLREIRKKPVVSRYLTHFLQVPFFPERGKLLSSNIANYLYSFRWSRIQEATSSLTRGMSRPKHDLQPTSLTTRRAEFNKHLSVSKKDFNAIEYLLRKGARQLEMYSSPGIRNIR
jgi:succinate dehydrogenase assembly factor 1